MKQRGSFAIRTLILETAAQAGEQGITKTRLLQLNILNYNRASRYLAELVQEGFLRVDPHSGRYSITGKGIALMKLAEEAATYIGPVNTMISKYNKMFIQA